MSVYIITRNRPGNLKKVVPRWLEQSMHVTLVVEGSEQERHRVLVSGMGWTDKVDIISPKAVNLGVGHARRFAVANAALRRLDSIIMSDDDMRPSPGSDMGKLLREAASPKVLGIGAVRPLHDWFSGGATKDRNDVILCPGGWGMQLFALNVQNTEIMGSFDSLLDCFGEDHELMRNGIAAGIPWLVHCGVKCDAIGARYANGGINSYISDGDRHAREVACRRIIHGRWPRYVSKPEDSPRMAWQKMLDDYITGWRHLSAMHGGEWR